jgi:signal peptidase I
MLMSEVDGEWVVDPADGGYRVLVAPGDHLVLMAGASYGKPAAGFRHPNIVARKCEVHEFKHYRKAGSKFWTARPGVNFYLVVPKDRIEMIPEKGYSYVPVKINGQKLVLNVSGGGGCGYPGWTDWVHRVVHTSVGFPKKTLKLLADVALSPEECKARGITFPLVGPDESDKQRFIRLAAEKDTKPTIKAGNKIVVDTNSCTWDSELSPIVTVVARTTGHTYRRGKTQPGGTYVMKPTQQQKVLATDDRGHQWRIKFSLVDWLKTAEANGIPLASSDAVNHIGPIVTEDEMELIEHEAV